MAKKKKKFEIKKSVKKGATDFIKTIVAVGFSAGGIEVAASGTPDLKTARATLVGAVVSAIFTGILDWLKHKNKKNK